MGERTKESLAEFYGKVAVQVWDGLGGELASANVDWADWSKAHVMSPHSVVLGIKDLADPDAALEDRVKGGVSATTGLAAKYAYVAEKIGARSMARFLGAWVGGVGFVTTAWDILTMMGRGYDAGHKIASARGEQAGMLVGLTAAVAWGLSADHGEHVYRSVRPDMIPGTFEVTHARAFNKGYYKGYNHFMSLPKEEAYEFQMLIMGMLQADVLRDSALVRFHRHRASFGHLAQGTKTNMVLPYVIHVVRLAAAVK